MAALEVVEDHPPRRTASQNDKVWLHDNVVEDCAGGVDAFVCECPIRAFGVLGLVDDGLVKTAKARSMDKGSGAVEEDAESDAARFDLWICGSSTVVKGRAESIFPEEKSLVEIGDDFLDVGPFFVSGTGRVKLCHDFLGEDAELHIVFEIDRWNYRRDLVAVSLRRCTSQYACFLA